ncbi:MAG TPA: acyl-CoA dehydrogenase domain-containing protein, partial [Pseudomonas sp.]|nr:acyl-CoA dehydrogenase domain-containing protein [Pseudomonas sp.]
AIIGGPAMLGKGWMMLMNCLSVGRSISLPAVGTSAAKTCAYASGRYARIREQFNVPLSAFEGIQAPLGRLAGNAWLMDAARVLTARAVDLGEKPSVLSAVLKYHLTERGRECIAHAMDIHGGKGIIMGPNNYLARAWQGAPIFITVEGANILSRNLMIFGQGAIRSHPYVLKEMELAAAEDSDATLHAFDRVLLEHVGFTASNAASAFLLGLTGGLLSSAPGHGLSRRYFRQLNRLAAAFALLADTSMLLLGGSLKRRERLSARLGDVLSYLYLGSAALKRFHDLGHPQEQEPLLRWALEESLRCAETAMVELLDNFPNRPLALLLRVLVFPLGIQYKGPSDALEAQLAAMLDAPLADPAMSRLLDGVYLPEEGTDALGALEYAWRHLHSNVAIHKLLQRALREGQFQPEPGSDLLDAALAAGVLNEPQANALREEEAARRRVIDVDDFDPEVLQPADGKVR